MTLSFLRRLGDVVDAASAVEVAVYDYLHDGDRYQVAVRTESRSKRDEGTGEKVVVTVAWVSDERSRTFGVLSTVVGPPGDDLHHQARTWALARLG